MLWLDHLAADRGNSWSLIAAVGAASSLIFLAEIAPAQETLRHSDFGSSETIEVIAAPIIHESETSKITLEREEIEDISPKNLADVLSTIPSLHVDQTASDGRVGSVYIRGADPNFALILLDGIPLNDPTNSRGGSFDLSTISAENIDRIEVNKTPLSSVYGSDAAGGVIHIFTRRPTEAGTAKRFGSEGGRFHYHNTYGSIYSRTESTGLSAFAGYFDGGSPLEGSSTINRTFNSHVDFMTGDGTDFRFAVNVLGSDRSAFPDDSGGPKYSELRRSEVRDTESVSAGINVGHALTGSWQMTLNTSIFSIDDGVDSPGVLPGVRDPFGIPPSMSDNDFKRYSVGLNNEFEIASKANLSFGADYKSEDGSSKSSLELGEVLLPASFDLERDTIGAFLDAAVRPSKKLSTFFNARIDNPQRYTSRLTPRAGVSYDAPSLRSVFGVEWGMGYKLPSFFSLAHPIVGDPSLEPERSEALELTAKRRFSDGIILSGSVFKVKFLDIVDFKEGPPPKLVNRPRADSEGAELSMNTKIHPSANADWFVTYTKLDIAGTSEEFRNRPDWRGGLNIVWRAGPASDIRLGALYMGSVLDSSIPTGDRTLDGYIRVDAGLTWRIGGWAKVRVALDNVLDERYEDAIGFEAPGITPRAGVEFQM